MRARSTDASVWPARTSTPPCRARNGKTWPGRARSAGRVPESMAARIVVARSEALIPVVVPRRASMDSVEGRAVIGRVDRSHQRKGKLVAALLGQRQADQAAAVLGHEVDGFGRYFFRRHREVAFVFAVFVVDQDDLPALADFFEGFLDGCKWEYLADMARLKTPGR